jgi:hypothetical protein
MISISSLAQRFRPRPAVLPPTPAIIPLMASQQQQALTISSQHQQPIKPSSLEISMPTLSLTSHVSSARIGHTSHSDTPSLVSDPVLGSSNSRLTPQETTFGSLPIHVLTPIVSF